MVSVIYDNVVKKLMERIHLYSNMAHGRWILWQHKKYRNVMSRNDEKECCFHRGPRGCDSLAAFSIAFEE
jgi:hypothetical protein